MFKYKEDIYQLSDRDLAFVCRVFLNKTMTDEEFNVVMSQNVLNKILSMTHSNIKDNNDKSIPRTDIVKEIAQRIFNNKYPFSNPKFDINEKEQSIEEKTKVNGNYNSNTHTIAINLDANETSYNLIYLLNHELVHSQQHFVAQFGAIKDNLQYLKNHENDFISDIIDFYKNKGCNVSKKDININNI